MRIVGGQFKGRSIAVPKTKETRPTMDRTREAVFNILLNAPWAKKEDGTSILNQSSVLDIFAGSGAYGLEALSHGANQVTFFESGSRACDAIEQNIFKFDIKEEARINRGDVLKSGFSVSPSADIAFFDPPYGQDLIVETIFLLTEKGWLSKDTLLVIETEAKYSDPMPENLSILSERIYGKSKIIIGRLT